MPLTVSVVAGQVAEMVDVCIGTHGPYPFVLDSGAGQSTIDAGLAHRLHLASAGAAEEFAGVGCTGTARPVTAGAWSLDGVPLSGQQLTAATLPQMAAKVRRSASSARTCCPASARPHRLRRRGARAAGPRGRAVGPVDTVHRTAGRTAGGADTRGERDDGAADGDAGLRGRVARRRGPLRRRPAADFVVDTGSSQSVVSSRWPGRRSDHRPGPAPVDRVLGDHSPARAQRILGGARVTLHPQLIGSTDFGAISLSGTQGLLGSDQLRRYGWVILDYADAQMVLG